MLQSKKKKLLKFSSGGGTISRIQATPNVITTGTPTTAAVTFTVPPVVGRGIVVVFNTFSATGTVTSVTDNFGNTYTLAVTRSEANLPNTLHIYYCAAITTTGASFTITVTGVAANRSMLAIEVGASITLDKTASANGVFPTPAATGPTAALTGATVFQVAEIGTSSSTIAVDALTPAWTQEAENPGGNPGTEIDSRVVTSAIGTTPGASWTLNGSNYWIAAIAVFK
jgi:hypothetical protein